jgi:hypothetical protein
MARCFSSAFGTLTQRTRNIARSRKLQHLKSVAAHHAGCLRIFHRGRLRCFPLPPSLHELRCMVCGELPDWRALLVMHSRLQPRGAGW